MLRGAKRADETAMAGIIADDSKAAVPLESADSEDTNGNV